ncbi:MAG: SxtJ family membrane protein, partial [Bryobacteraceae bacterium]|nr:SxtJ family membrane protein [Bryobacteraceae bacterium]
LTPLNRLWAKFGLLLHRLVSPVILAILFYGCITPIGYLMRLTGKDPLRLRFESDRQSYWIARDTDDISSFNNQF